MVTGQPTVVWPGSPLLHPFFSPLLGTAQGLRASRCQAVWEAALLEAWREAGQGWACGLLGSPTQLLSLSTAQNNLFRATGSDEWVLLNLNVTGYYLVNYDVENWRKIQTQLQTDLSVGVCSPTPSPAQAPGPRWRPRLPGLPPLPA